VSSEDNRKTCVHLNGDSCGDVSWFSGDQIVKLVTLELTEV